MATTSGKSLVAQYGVWGAHPDHAPTDWQHEVASGDTRSGYWDWVAAKLDCDS
ncbi:hypothetical protein GS896_27565 [Rhodococcus hoagii]|nr:hypothetical protein [Prescottella equi]MBM4654011.1 hypothetical protein [Prescottella equi]MBM4719726.1 hypothetical protein [Prescottella equi]NKR23523.1 hypothetical protein [Prescottella equi]NKT56323.1 hypothetical protein [Prescottella equi]